MSEVAEAFTIEELDLEHGELLPARETMGCLDSGRVLAINLAAAVNLHSPWSRAAAIAAQKVIVL